MRSDFVLVVPATSPAKTVADLTQAARAQSAKGERVNFGTFGAGTPGHFGAEMYGETAGFKVEPVHYRATGDAATAIIAGDVQAAFVSTALAVAQVKGGKMRALGVTSPQRLPQLPDVPTFAEAGLPKVDVTVWFADLLFRPACRRAAAGRARPRRRRPRSRCSRPRRSRSCRRRASRVFGSSRTETVRMLRAEAPRAGRAS